MGMSVRNCLLVDRCAFGGQRSPLQELFLSFCHWLLELKLKSSGSIAGASPAKPPFCLPHFSFSGCSFKMDHYLFYVCRYLFCTDACGSHAGIYPQRQDEGPRYPGTDVTNSCKSLCGCGESNLAPLEEQQVLLSAEPSVQSPLGLF